MTERDWFGMIFIYPLVLAVMLGVPTGIYLLIRWA